MSDIEKSQIELQVKVLNLFADMIQLYFKYIFSVDRDRSLYL